MNKKTRTLLIVVGIAVVISAMVQQYRALSESAENTAVPSETAVDTNGGPGALLLDFCNDALFSAHFENLDANPPVKMEYHRDECLDETVTDVQQILAEIESLKNMRIGGESDVRVTDSGISYWFTMADGTEWGVSFEAPGLFCWHNKVYEVLHD